MTFEVEGLGQLSAELGKAAAVALPAITEATRVASGELRDVWKANARETAGKHGKLYPSTITLEQVPSFGAATFDIGPESGKRQGGMGRGFEYGSLNQPPHFDGRNAADEVEPRLVHALEAIVEGLL